MVNAVTTSNNFIISFVYLAVPSVPRVCVLPRSVSCAILALDKLDVQYVSLS